MDDDRYFWTGIVLAAAFVVIGYSQLLPDFIRQCLR